jgi:hypothetical protein
MTFSSGVRKLTLATHVMTSVGWFGAVAAFLALAISGLAMADSQTVRSAYISMGVMTWFVIVPFSIAAPKPGVSRKEGAKDVPSWAKGQRPRVGESRMDFAKRLLDGKYGPGNYDKGPGSEFSQIQKSGIGHSNMSDVMRPSLVSTGSQMTRARGSNCHRSTLRSYGWLTIR